MGEAAAAVDVAAVLSLSDDDSLDLIVMMLEGKPQLAACLAHVINFTGVPAHAAPADEKGQAQKGQYQTKGNTKGAKQMAGSPVGGTKRPCPSGGEGQRYTGTIKSFVLEKGFGFIECPELFQVYGRDTWLHNAQLQGFQLGDTVEFEMALNKQGNPQALALTLPTAMGGGKKAKGKGAGGKAVGQPMQSQLGEGQRFAGTIKSFCADKGFGFIECSELFEVYGRDTWLHHAQKQHFQKGEAVEFTMALSKEGNPQAVDLAPHGQMGTTATGGKNNPAAARIVGQNYVEPMDAWAARVAPMDAAAATPMPGKGGKPSKGKGTSKSNNDGSPPWVQAADDQRYSGIVKSFVAKPGFGFIDCPPLKEAYGRDTWVHGKQLGNFKVGDCVVFSMSLNQQGHPQALNLEAAGGHPQGLDEEAALLIALSEQAALLEAMTQQGHLQGIN